MQVYSRQNLEENFFQLFLLDLVKTLHDTATEFIQKITHHFKHLLII